MSDRSVKFQLRPLRAEDSEAIFLLKQASTRTLNARDYTPEQIQALCGGKTRKFRLDELKITDSVALFIANSTRQNFDNNYSSIVAYLEDREDKIIGYGFIQIDNLSWVNNGTIFELFVAPEYSRRGVGTKILQTMEDDARKHDCKIISAGASLTATPFYQSREYQIIERGSFFCCGVGIPIVFMQKWLVNPTAMERSYWQGTEEFNRKTSWLFTEAGLSREIFG